MSNKSKARNVGMDIKTHIDRSKKKNIRRKR